jgi:type III pantothenate kinase
MIIALDIGNTQILTGCFDTNGKILLKFRVATNENLTEDEFFSYLKTITDFNKLNIENIDGIVISSVVPTLDHIFIYLAKKYFKIKPIIVNSNLSIPLTFDVDNPKEVGADRIVNVVEAINKYKKDELIVIDFGTATTFEAVKNNCYIGGCILPGINLALSSLFKNTSKLPKIKFERASSIIGKNTIEHINSGIYFGYIGQVKEILKEMKKILPNASVIATGGLAGLISESVSDIDILDLDLTLNGLYTIYILNK